jgi:hypothetical protein
MMLACTIRPPSGSTATSPGSRRQGFRATVAQREQLVGASVQRIGRNLWRTAVVAAIAALGLAFASSQASAAVYAYLSHPNHGDDAKLIGKVRKAKCQVKGSGGQKRFVAVGSSTNNAIDLHVKIGPKAWQGFDHKYNLYSGDSETAFLGVVDANADYDGYYTNAYAVPGFDGYKVGEIRFSDGGSKLQIGSYYGPNRSNPEYGIVLGGGGSAQQPEPGVERCR